MDFAKRIERTCQEQERSDIDAMLVAPSADLVYLIGYDPPPLERLTALVLRPGRDAVLFVPQLEVPLARRSPAAHLLDVQGWRDGDDPYERLRDILAPAARLAVSDRMWSSHLLGLQAALPNAEFVTASGLLGRVRARKDRGETDLLRRAAAGADEAFSQAMKEGLEGRREQEVARLLSEHLLAAGHESVAFAIVASGPNGASPHHQPGDRVLAARDAVVLDFGGRIGGYCSDISRTVAVGEAPRGMEEVHDVVRMAQQAAFEAVAPGTAAGEVDEAARNVIEDAGYGREFVHRTGHGIGLEEHEPPFIVAGNTERLEPGMCFSIEPGIYLEGRFGVRIEDIVTVTEIGAERLNLAPRELIVVR